MAWKAPFSILHLEFLVAPSMRLVLFGILLAGIQVGCGPSTVNVTGTVTMAGKPVVWGTVNLLAENGQTFQGQIQPDGKYTVQGAPLGTLKATVFSPDPLPPSSGAPRKEALSAALSGKAELRARWFPIPDKYSNFESSGLAVNAGRNPTQFDITLKE